MLSNWAVPAVPAPLLAGRRQVNARFMVGSVPSGGERPVSCQVDDYDPSTAQREATLQQIARV